MSTDWLAVAADLCHPAAPAPVCPTCEGRGWIDDPAHPIGGSYEDFLAAGPAPWIDCPDCAATRETR